MPYGLNFITVQRTCLKNKQDDIVDDRRIAAEKVAEYDARFHRYPGSLQELVDEGFIDSIPHEPHGYDYILYENTVKSTYIKNTSVPD